MPKYVMSNIFHCNEYQMLCGFNISLNCIHKRGHTIPQEEKCHSSRKSYILIPKKLQSQVNREKKILYFNIFMMSLHFVLAQVNKLDSWSTGLNMDMDTRNFVLDQTKSIIFRERVDNQRHACKLLQITQISTYLSSAYIRKYSHFSVVQKNPQYHLLPFGAILYSFWQGNPVGPKLNQFGKANWQGQIAYPRIGC